jgi:hypothetical protein
MNKKNEYQEWKKKRGEIIASATMIGTKKSKSLDRHEKYPMEFYKGDIVNAIGEFNPLEHFHYLQNQAYTIMGDFINNYTVDGVDYVSSGIIRILKEEDVSASDLRQACHEMVPLVMSELPSFNNLDPADVYNHILQTLVINGFFSTEND